MSAAERAGLPATEARQWLEDPSKGMEEVRAAGAGSQAWLGGRGGGRRREAEGVMAGVRKDGAVIEIARASVCRSAQMTMRRYVPRLHALRETQNRQLREETLCCLPGRRAVLHLPSPSPPLSPPPAAG